MRFHEFLRATVMLSAASASLLALVSLAAVAAGRGGATVAEIGVGWWLLAGAIGLWLGRQADASPPIATLLASARTRASVPQLAPARVLVNRLWPLFVVSLGAVLVGIALPQVPALAAGFAIMWSLLWRRQSTAVQAIERRDGTRFYLESTSPLRAIELMRTPGLRGGPGPGDPAAVRPATR